MVKKRTGFPSILYTSACLILSMLLSAPSWGDPGTLKWRFSAGGEINASPVIGPRGNVYVGSDDGCLYAIRSNGEEQWRYQTDGPVSSSPVIDAEGTIYVGSADTHLYAVNSDGSRKWRFQTEGAISSSPAIDANGNLYVGSADHRVYAIDSKGKEIWQYETAGPVSSSPALSATGVIHVGSKDHHVYAIDTDDGEEKWTYAADGPLSSSPAIASNVIYVGSDDGQLHAVGTNDGGVKWTYPTEAAAVSSSPAVTVGGTTAGGTIYVGAGDHLHAIYASSGEARWTFPTSGAIRSSPAIGSDSVVYVASSDGYLYAVNANGSEEWRLEIGESVSSPVISPDQTVYIGSRDGTLSAVESSSEGLLKDSSWPMFRHDMRHTGRNTANRKPTANAGDDRTVEEGANVTLDGSRSTDPDYGIATYKWTQTDGTSVTISNSDKIYASFEAPEIDISEEEDHITFKLTVTDTHGSEDTDTCTIKVEEEEGWCFVSALGHGSIWGAYLKKLLK